MNFGRYYIIFINTKLFKTFGNDTNVVLGNALGAVGIKGFGLVISFFYMPLFIRYFNNLEVLGVWYTVLSVVNWILYFDLGIGNGLRNKLTEALAARNKTLVCQYISSAYFMIGGIVVILSVLGLILLSNCDLNAIFNVPNEIIPANTMLKCVSYIYIGMMLQLFLRIITSILYALQKSAVNNLMSLFTSVLNLLFVMFAPSYSAEINLLMLSFAFVFFTNIPLLIATFLTFQRELKSYSPKWSLVDKACSRGVLGLGGMFFICQITYMLIVNTNEFFIAQYTAPKYVVVYSIYYKLFSLAGMMMMLMLTPVWSAVTKAVAENNFIWLRKLHSALLKVTGIIVIGEFMLIVVLQPIINLWLGKEAFQVDISHALIFAAFGSIFVYQSVLSSFACGTGKIRIQIISYTAAVFAKFVLIPIFINWFDSWIVIIGVNALILLPYCIIEQIHIMKILSQNYITAVQNIQKQKNGSNSSKVFL